jgi:hypothetical protein
LIISIKFRKIMNIIIADFSIHFTNLNHKG